MSYPTTFMVDFPQLNRFQQGNPGSSRNLKTMEKSPFSMVAIRIAEKKSLKIWLVVSTNPSEKWWSSSVGMMIFPIYGKSFKIPWFQTTNQPLLQQKSPFSHGFPMVFPTTKQYIIINVHQQFDNFPTQMTGAPPRIHAASGQYQYAQCEVTKSNDEYYQSYPHAGRKLP